MLKKAYICYIFLYNFLCYHHPLKLVARPQLNWMKLFWTNRTVFSCGIAQFISGNKPDICHWNSYSFCSERTRRHSVLLIIILWCIHYSQFTSCVILFLSKTESFKYWTVQQISKCVKYVICNKGKEYVNESLMIYFKQALKFNINRFSCVFEVNVTSLFSLSESWNVN